MLWSSTTLLVVAAFALNGVLSLALAGHAHRNRDNPAATEFRNFAAIAGVWTTTELAVMASPTQSLALTADVLAEASGIFVIVSFVVFAFTYTQSRFGDPRVVRGLYVLGAIYCLAFAVPNDVVLVDRTVDSFLGLRIVVREWTNARVPVVVGAYVLTFGALGSLLRFVLDATNIYRKQAAIVFASALLVTVATSLRVAGVVPEGFNPAGAVRAVEVGLIWVAIYRYDFLSVMPLAKDALVDTIDDPVLVLDADDDVVYANDAATGLDDALQRGVTVDDAVDGLLDALDHDDDFATTVDDGFATDGGTEHVYEPGVTPLVDQFDVERGRVVVLHDVTEQRNRERRLEEFASVVSHDLRNPLAVADGYVRERHDKTGHDHLAEALVSLDRMDEMIDELLTLAHNGYDDITPTSHTLGDAARRAWRTVDTGASTLEVVDEMRTVVADEHQFDELLQNLFRNAVEHNPDPVTVRVGSTDDGFYVADDGVGIPEHERDAVLETGYTTNEDGTGVGLGVVGRFADAHGWRFDVCESAGGGARFEFSTTGD